MRPSPRNSGTARLRNGKADLVYGVLRPGPRAASDEAAEASSQFDRFERRYGRQRAQRGFAWASLPPPTALDQPPIIPQAEGLGDAAGEAPRRWPKDSLATHQKPSRTALHTLAQRGWRGHTSGQRTAFAGSRAAAPTRIRRWCSYFKPARRTFAVQSREQPSSARIATNV